MSLISDALRAAQDARSRSPRSSARTAAARRILAPPAVPRSGRHRARGPRQLGGALAVFALAVLVAAAVVVAAPEAGGLSGSVARTSAAGAGNALLSGSRAPTSPEPAPMGDTAAGSSAIPADDSPAQREDISGDPGIRGGVAPAEPAEDDAAASPSRILGGETRAGRDPGFELRLEAPARGSGHLFDDARAAQERREYAMAARLYQQALVNDPDDPEILNNLGTVHQAAGDLLSAREAFTRAVDVSPRYSSAWCNLGIALAALGDSAGARAALTEALRLDPGNRSASVNLAVEYQKQGLNGTARRMLREVLTRSPEMAEAHYALARILEEDGDRTGAINHYRRFLSARGDEFPSLAPAVTRRIAELGG